MMLTSKENNRALEKFNVEILEIMIDRRITPIYLLSLLSKITNPESTSQFKLVKGSNSVRANNLLIHNAIPILFHNNMLTFPDKGKQCDLKGGLLKRITNKNYYVDLPSLSDNKVLCDFAKEIIFGVRAPDKKFNRDTTLIEILKSPGLMISASGNSNTKIIPSDPNERCNRLKFLLQEKQAGNSSHIINEEIVAKVDNLIEYKCISKKQHKQTSIKCNLLHNKDKVSVNTHIVCIITHINICIQKYKYSYNCMYTQL